LKVLGKEISDKVQLNRFSTQNQSWFFISYLELMTIDQFSIEFVNILSKSGL